MPEPAASPSGRQEVDAYIASAPAPAQPLLRTLRAIVISEAPNATERLSYGMPYYGYHGRVVYFAAHKEHVGVYGLAGLGGAVAELQDYFAERGTLRFPFDRPLPADALHAAIRARVRQNEAASLTRATDPSRPGNRPGRAAGKASASAPSEAGNERKPE